MADMMKKVPVREQDPKVRATNFEEVCLGYNKEEAMKRLQDALTVRMQNVSRVVLYPSTFQHLSSR